MKICICGGGNLGLVCAGVFLSEGHQVRILSGHPETWGSSVVVTDSNGKVYEGVLDKVSGNPQDVIPSQDIILLCLPGYLIEKKLYEIKPFIGTAIVGSIVSSTGFFFAAHKILGTSAKIFGLQRVPYIARTISYGNSARLLGYKSGIAIAVENVDDLDLFRNTMERLFNTPTRLLSNYYEAALTNSNPILHTGRLYTMYRGLEHHVFNHNILFYKEWTDSSSRILIEMDKEFFELLNKLKVTGIPSLLEYYESHDASSLTKKISSIEAFQDILSPMKPIGDGWIVDFSSRYFTEDFPYGLRYIKDLCSKYGIDAPAINEVYKWGISQIGG